MEYRKLKDLVEINSENITKNYKEQTINYLDTANITNGKIDKITELGLEKAPSRAKRIVRENDIIYSTVRPNLCHYGILRKVLKNMIVSTGFVVLRCKEEILPEYLYAYITLPFITNKLYSIAETSTSAYPSIKPKDIENLVIPVPPKEIQQKIANIISSIDKKIEINNQINDNLYKITSKLYEHTFITNRKEKWKEYKLMDIANIYNGYSYKGAELVEESKVGMATIKNFDRTGGFKEDGFKPLEPLKAKDVHYVEKFDVLVACTDLTQNADIIGNTIMLLSKNDYDKVIISMDLVKAVPRSEYINNYMLYSILSSTEFKNFALGYTSGTTVLHLNKNCFKKFSIKLPDKIEIEKFVKVVEPMYLRISEIMEENKTLEQLRNTLLPKLMNEEIDLDNIAI